MENGSKYAKCNNDHVATFWPCTADATMNSTIAWRTSVWQTVRIKCETERTFLSTLTITGQQLRRTYNSMSFRQNHAHEIHDTTRKDETLTNLSCLFIKKIDIHIWTYKSNVCFCSYLTHLQSKSMYWNNATSHTTTVNCMHNNPHNIGPIGLIKLHAQT